MLKNNLPLFLVVAFQFIDENCDWIESAFRVDLYRICHIYCCFQILF
jgi:hypothetical protein